MPLFARPSPTVVIRPPLPRWLAALRLGALLLALALYGAAAFRAGQSAPLHSAPVPEASVPQIGVAAAPAGKTAQEPAPPGGEEALRIREFSASLPAGSGKRLRYDLTLTNAGRKFSGTLEFTLTGKLNGTESVLTHPDTARPRDKTLSIAVQRHLKTGGWLPLPEEFAPRDLTVRLRDAEGIRATRTITLAPSA